VLLGRWLGRAGAGHFSKRRDFEFRKIDAIPTDGAIGPCRGRIRRGGLVTWFGIDLTSDLNPLADHGLQLLIVNELELVHRTGLR
jgi:hypothetical protein